MPTIGSQRERKNMGKWHLGVEKGAQELEDTWKRADKRESDRRHRRETAASTVANRRIAPAPVSYTHLTLPTKA